MGWWVRKEMTERWPVPLVLVARSGESSKSWHNDRALERRALVAKELPVGVQLRGGGGSV